MTMNLNSVTNLLPQSRVLLRLDLDLPFVGDKITDSTRLLKSLPTLRLLLEKDCRLIIIGHRGRPQGVDPTLSLRPVYVELMSLLDADDQNPLTSVFIDKIDQTLLETSLENNQIVFLENLRFWPGEEANDPSFLAPLQNLATAYANDAFAVAHRSHASVTLHRLLPAFYGLSFIDEFTHLQTLLDPLRPFTLILGGAKEDKLKHLPQLLTLADRVLLGGKLPLLTQVTHPKLFLATLVPTGLDIDEASIAHFTEIINNSKTIVWAGAMGLYEDPNYQNGTEQIAKAMAAVSAYKVIAGGDTAASVQKLSLKNSFDFICSGGGVLLEFLVNQNLPAWS